MLQFLFGSAFVVELLLAGKLIWEQHLQQEQQEELREAYESGKTGAEAENADGRQKLADLNGDYLGWLTVYGTEVDLPVVQGTDNDYYLDHDFYGEENRYGCLFADFEGCEDGNLLIYGHHMKDGSMFGDLQSFKKKEFFREHGLVRWEQGSETEYYEIFAVLVVPGYEDDEQYFSIRNYLPLLDEDETAGFLEELRGRASLWKDLDISDQEKFMFLMTCDYTRTDGRLLLCARRMEMQ